MELTANALQTVTADSNVVFTNTTVLGCQSILHREDSGLVTLRGITCQNRARFKVYFGANVALPTGGTVGPISLALAINGEPIAATTMIVTPAAVEEFNNVSRATFVDIPSGCCAQISVRNLTEEDIEVQNANLIIERVA